MALEPYQRRIGIPDTAGAGVQPLVSSDTIDIGGAVSQLGQRLMRAYEPVLQNEALNRARDEAGAVTFQRNENGQLVLPERTEGRGLVFSRAFDQIIEERYLNAVGTDYQTFLDQEVAARRAGERPFDPRDFAATVRAHTDGVLNGIDPRLRGNVEELFNREAGERTRQFLNEWSRTEQQNQINGLNAQLRTNMEHLANYRDMGLTLDEARARFLEPAQQAITRLRDINAIGGEEADAMFMNLSKVTNGLEHYASSMEYLATILPAVGGMSMEDTQRLLYWSMDVPVEGSLSGLVTERGVGSELVTPDLLRSTYAEMFGSEPTSVERSTTDPLTQANPRSYHSIANGGRAIDSPAIEGMTFDEYVQSWRDRGFEVLEAINEYENPSAHATGGHWHIALGNRRTVDVTNEVPGLQGVTREQIMSLDPEALTALRTILVDRQQVLRAQAAEERRVADEERRHQETLRELAEIDDGIAGANSNGTGGNWSAKERGRLDQVFEASIDLATLNNPQTRAQVLGFIQQNNYLPDQIMSFMDNAIRSQDWQPALEFYQNIKGAVVGEGPRAASVGDLLLSSMEPRTAALLQQADALYRMNHTREEIGAFIEASRAGTAYTVREAVDVYNRRFADDPERSYTADSERLARNSLGLGETATLPPSFMGDFDTAFAANLDLLNGNVERAMARAGEQVRGRFRGSTIFKENIGPSVLLRNYTPQQIFDFLREETQPDGSPLVLRVPGQGHRLGGTNPSIRLEPSDSETGTIGRYRVYVYEPNRTSNLLDWFEVDLGAELRRFYANRPAPTAPDNPWGGPVDRARLRRAAERRANFGDPNNFPLMP